MQRMSVERTHYILLYVYGRGLGIKRSGLSPVGNAHRAFRDRKHGRMPFGRATGEPEIDELKTLLII